MSDNRVLCYICGFKYSENAIEYHKTHCLKVNNLDNFDLNSLVFFFTNDLVFFSNRNSHQPRVFGYIKN